MNEFQTFLPNLLLIYLAYIVATASPGPATLAIMTTSMKRGRKTGIIFGLGIFTGSITWAALALSGVSKLLHVYSSAFIMLKILGGSYLLWMAYKAFNSARSTTASQSGIRLSEVSLPKIYLQALALHLSNPKAAFAWLAIVSVGIQEATPLWVIISIFVGCAILGLSIFISYAFIFSSKIMISKYQKARRPIEGFMSLVFGFAGLKLILDEA